MNQIKTLYAIDASIYIFQVYFSQSQSMSEAFVSKSGRPVGTVYGFTLWLVNFLLKESPEYIAVCFDESLETGFRHQICPMYKSNRALPDDELAYELLACKKISQLLGLPCFASDIYEADDFIASSIAVANANGINSVIVSRDKDLFQLLELSQASNKASKNTSEICAWHYPKGEKIFASDVYQKFGVHPQYFADFLAIVGDSSDAIEGIPGVGAKTVAKLFNAYPGWQALQENINDVHKLSIRGAARVQNLLIEHSDTVVHNLQLTTLANDIFAKDDEYNSIDILSLVKHEKESLFNLLDEFNLPKHIFKKIDRFCDRNKS